MFGDATDLTPFARRPFPRMRTIRCHVIWGENHTCAIVAFADNGGVKATGRLLAGVKDRAAEVPGMGGGRGKCRAFLRASVRLCSLPAFDTVSRESCSRK